MDKEVGESKKTNKIRLGLDELSLDRAGSDLLLNLEAPVLVAEAVAKSLHDVDCGGGGGEGKG